MKEATAMTGEQSHVAYGDAGFVIASTEVARRRANATATAMFDACMQSKGWKKQQQVGKPSNEATTSLRPTGRRYVGDGISPPFPPHLQGGCYWIIDRTTSPDGKLLPRDLFEYGEQCIQ